MSADSKKLAAIVVGGLPPPDRLKKGAPMDNTDGDEDTESSDDKAGEMAMDDFRQAFKDGDSAAMFEALKTAYSHC